MPTGHELQSRNSSWRATKSTSISDEVLVADQRGRMSPGNFVEQKLRMALTVERPSRRSPK